MIFSEEKMQHVNTMRVVANVGAKGRVCELLNEN